MNTDYTNTPGEHVGARGLTIVTTTSDNYAPLFDIFRRTLRAEELGYRLIVADIDLSRWADHYFRSDSWYHAAHVKFDALLDVMQQTTPGEYVVFSDADIQFFRPELLPDLVQSARTDALDVSGAQEGDQVGVYNGGFLLLRNSPRVRELLVDVRDNTRTTRAEFGDQTWFNHLLHTKYSDLRHAPISAAKYVLGPFVDISLQPIFHHAVCAATVDEKLNQMTTVANQLQSANAFNI
jgi:hypothetical protein